AICSARRARTGSRSWMLVWLCMGIVRVMASGSAHVMEYSALGGVLCRFVEADQLKAQPAANGYVAFATGPFVLNAVNTPACEGMARASDFDQVTDLENVRSRL